MLVTCLECSLRDIHTFFFMDISLEVDLNENPGKSGLTISRRTVLFWGLHLSTLQDLHRTEVSGGSYTQLGLLACGDPVFIARALSQVKYVNSITSTFGLRRC